MRSRISVLCLVVTVLFVSAALMGADDALAFQKAKDKKPGGGGKPPSTIDVLQLVFRDNMTAGETARVVSDGVVIGSGGVTYTDRRIPEDGEPCVTARFASGGSTWSHLDRGSSSTESPLLNNCAAQRGITPRTYVLEFPYDPDYDPSAGGAGCACDALQLGDPDGDGSCSLAVDTGNDGAPRISTSSLFKKKDRTATIDLMFRHDLDPEDQVDPESFVISSNNPLTIGGADPHVYLQTQSSGEEFRLNSLSSETQCSAFPFSLSIDFIKVTVTQTGGAS